MNDFINFDHAAGTPVNESVLETMRPYLADMLANPSSIHTTGLAARKAVETAREQVAALIGASAKEIIFTSCGTESNNFALKGVAHANTNKGRHLIYSGVDHLSVYRPAMTLKKAGWDVDVALPDTYGYIDPAVLTEKLRDDTILVSVTHASNEIGTIEPIRDLAHQAKERGVLFHTDAIQVAGVMPVDVNDLDVDLMSLASNAFYGPGGAAALYIRERTRIAPLLEGGMQERGRRAGTENVAAIVGMGAAAERAMSDMESRNAHTTILRDRLLTGLESSIPKLHLNGDRTNRLPGNIHVSIEAIEGESMVFSLAGEKILAASGSSCADKTLKSSHVLDAIGLDPALANASVMFTLGYENTEAEVDRVLEVFPAMVARLRSMSPLWDG